MHPSKAIFQLLPYNSIVSTETKFEIQTREIGWFFFTIFSTVLKENFQNLYQFVPVVKNNRIIFWVMRAIFADKQICLYVSNNGIKL